MKGTKSHVVKRSARRQQLGTDCSEGKVIGKDSDGADVKLRHLAKQEHKTVCDINNVMLRAQTGAGLSHLARHGGEYGDFSHWDENTYENMQIEKARGVSIFNELPAELRAEFDNNPGKFFQFVNDPKNNDRLEELFPQLSQPGRQFPDIMGGLATSIDLLNETLAAPSSDGPPEEGATNE